MLADLKGKMAMTIRFDNLPPYSHYQHFEGAGLLVTFATLKELQDFMEENERHLDGPQEAGPVASSISIRPKASRSGTGDTEPF